MGFLTAPDDVRTEFLVVVTARGKLQAQGGALDGAHAKARVFVLEDRTAVVILPDTGPRKLRWYTFAVDSSTYNAATRKLTVTLADPDAGVLTVDGQNCGCGMGAVGNAGPADAPYKLTPVRSPEWHSAV